MPGQMLGIRLIVERIAPLESFARPYSLLPFRN
ncbi:hypothetical protein BH09CHL1_BH09CHL1_16870 [soil metagenome]